MAVQSGGLTMHAQAAQYIVQARALVSNAHLQVSVMMETHVHLSHVILTYAAIFNWLMGLHA
jgi:hypothetical protein